jgi:alpha-beta hydrolase superfamily lysophospholipase
VFGGEFISTSLMRTSLISPGEVEATARACHTQAEVLPGMAHDMMLEAGWQAVADQILCWLNEQGL